MMFYEQEDILPTEHISGPRVPDLELSKQQFLFSFSYLPTC